MSLKRAFDVAASATALAVLSPVLATVAVVSSIYFHKSPLYLADRQGVHGKPFKMLKFRSLTGETDGNGVPLTEGERITRLGKFLRATAIDELPQLVNILKGDMSFVGPRPHYPTEAIPPRYSDILDVRPGLTGPWQVEAIGKLLPSSDIERFEIESKYVKGNPTFIKDLQLMLKTIPAFTKGHDGETLTSPVKKPDGFKPK